MIGVSQNTNSQNGYVTIKYAPNGNRAWAARLDSTNYPNARPSGLTLDGNGNVVVTGSALTIKYDFNGNQLWSASYPGKALAIDASGNVYVVGFGTTFNTVKLSPLGSNVWLTTYVDVGPTISQTVLVDAATNIYVSGSDGFHASGTGGYYVQVLTVKYDANGRQIWYAGCETGPAAVLSVIGCAVDNSGNCYLSVNVPTWAPYATFKYNANGILQWDSYNPTGGILSSPTGLALVGQSGVIVTGEKNTVVGSDFSYVTYNIDTSGNYTWTNVYPANPVGVSGANAIAKDQSGSVYVTGYSPGANSSNNIVTIKYDPNGNQVWLQRYSGLNNGGAVGNAIAVDNNGNVYVAGYEATAAGGAAVNRRD